MYPYIIITLNCVVTHKNLTGKLCDLIMLQWRIILSNTHMRSASICLSIRLSLVRTQMLGILALKVWQYLYRQYLHIGTFSQIGMLSANNTASRVVLQQEVHVQLSI